MHRVAELFKLTCIAFHDKIFTNYAPRWLLTGSNDSPCIYFEENTVYVRWATKQSRKVGAVGWRLRLLTLIKPGLQNGAYTHANIPGREEQNNNGDQSWEKNITASICADRCVNFWLIFKKQFPTTDLCSSGWWEAAKTYYVRGFNS